MALSQRIDSGDTKNVEKENSSKSARTKVRTVRGVLAFPSFFFFDWSTSTLFQNFIPSHPLSSTASEFTGLEKLAHAYRGVRSCFCLFLRLWRNSVENSSTHNELLSIYITMGFITPGHSLSDLRIRMFENGGAGHNRVRENPTFFFQPRFFHANLLLCLFLPMLWISRSDEPGCPSTWILEILFGLLPRRVKFASRKNMKCRPLLTRWSPPHCTEHYTYCRSVKMDCRCIAIQIFTA